MTPDLRPEGTTPEEWLGIPDPVEVVRRVVDEALQRLAVELAAIRAERDGLRLELEGLRAQLDTARATATALGLRTEPAPAPDPEPEPTFVAVASEHDPYATEVGAGAPGLERLLALPGVSLGGAGAPPRRRARLEPRRVGALAAAGVAALAVASVTVGPLVLPYQTTVVRSGSMEPAVDTGELLFLREVPAAEIGEGDVITFERPGDDALVTHRVVAVEDAGTGRQFVTRGDANDSADPWRLPAAGTFWRRSFGIPLVGYLFTALSTAVARVLLVAVPAGVVGVTVLRGRREDRTEPPPPAPRPPV